MKRERFIASDWGSSSCHEQRADRARGFVACGPCNHVQSRNLRSLYWQLSTRRAAFGTTGSRQPSASTSAPTPFRSGQCGKDSCDALASRDAARFAWKFPSPPPACADRVSNRLRKIFEIKICPGGRLKTRPQLSACARAAPAPALLVKCCSAPGVLSLVATLKIAEWRHRVRHRCLTRQVCGLSEHSCSAHPRSQDRLPDRGRGSK